MGLGQKEHFLFPYTIKKRRVAFIRCSYNPYQRKNPESFVNFALRGYFYAGKHILNNWYIDFSGNIFEKLYKSPPWYSWAGSTKIKDTQMH
jgi:hypothetical protein